MRTTQKSKVKSKKERQNLKRGLLPPILISVFLVLNFALPGFAKEITLIYTGETHAMLYPCNCPKEPDGGIARRATLIKQLKKKYPNSLVLDSGAIFAGGLLDEYTQNTELDQKRSEVNLRALGLMGYDAVTIGDDEFNFGRQYLQDSIAKSKLNFLSCNVKSDKVHDYIIKDISGVKVAVIGVTGLTAMSKADGLKFSDPKIALKASVEELRNKGVDIIVLLSHLGEAEDVNLANSISGIDVIITGHAFASEASSYKVGNTILLRPTWQGRRLGIAHLDIKDKKVAGFKAVEERLSDKIADDSAIRAMLPRCFSDANCKKEGLTGTCMEPGTLKASCVFSAPIRVGLTVITPRGCDVCETETILNYLKRQLPGLKTSYLYYPDKKADNLIKDFSIKGLPAYILDKSVEKEKNFEALKPSLDQQGEKYMLKTQFTGFSYFLGRKPEKGKLDLFISIFDKSAHQVLDAVKDFNPEVHFLAIERENKLEAAAGTLEVEEYERALCVQKYYPDNFWSYLTCRVKNPSSSWWEDCLDRADSVKIRVCAKGGEGAGLLKENIKLNKELQIMFGPAYLKNNQEVFSTKGTPTKKELQKILKR